MAHSIPAHINPELLRWARKTAHLSLSQAANSSRFDSKTLESWEKGNSLPTIAKLRHLGKTYRRPIAVFFLPKPPKEPPPQKEFRKLPGTIPGEESPQLIQTIRDASYKRQAALELIEMLNEKVEKINYKLDPNCDPELGGATIRNSLSVFWNDQIRWRDKYKALRSWKSAIEARSILVFQTSLVPMEEMRGICMPDQPLPIIVVNSKDSPNGRVFSLIHEYAHILFHLSGYQASRMDGITSLYRDLEQAANAFAAAALLPKKEFLRVAKRYPGAFEGEDTNLQRLANKVKVSPEATLRRLVEIGHAKETTYQEKRKYWGSIPWYEKKSSAGAIPQFVRVIARDGRYFPSLVLDAYDQRLISTSNAIDFLDTKPKHFSKIREELVFR